MKNDVSKSLLSRRFKIKRHDFILQHPGGYLGVYLAYKMTFSYLFTHEQILKIACNTLLFFSEEDTGGA